MKRITALTIGCFAALAAAAQTKIELKDIAAHVGDSVLVCGSMSGGRFFASSKDSLTLLNIGGTYPNNPLTVLIRPDVRASFSEVPETALKGKNICVAGKVILYHDKPEIILYSKQQLVSVE